MLANTTTLQELGMSKHLLTDAGEYVCTTDEPQNMGFMVGAVGWFYSHDNPTALVQAGDVQARAVQPR